MVRAVLAFAQSWARERWVNGQPFQRVLILVAMTPLVVILAVMGWVMSQSIIAQKTQEEGQRIAAEAKVFAEMIDMTIGRQMIDLQSRASLLPKLKLDQSPAQLTLWLNGIQEAVPEYTWIGFVGMDGRVKASTGSILAGQSVAHRDWFQKGAFKPSTLDVHEAKLLESHLPARHTHDPWRFIDLTSPVKNAEGKTIGVLGAHLSWDWLVNQYRRYSASLFGSGAAEVMVIGRDGKPRLVAPGLENRGLGGKTSFQHAELGQSGFIQETWDDGRDYLVGYTKNPGYGEHHQLGWTTLVRLPMSHVQQQTQPLIVALWILIAAAILIFYAGTRLFIRLTLEPVNRLMSEIQRVGRHGGSLLTTGVMPREFQSLAVVTNQMIQTLDAQREMEHAKTRFLADMSHEIRTPLHGVLGIAELMKSRMTKPDDRRDLAQLIGCAREVQGLVDDILDLSATQENRLRLESKPFLILEVVDFNRRIFEPMAAAKGIRFEHESTVEPTLVVMGDPLRFGQVLRNLLSNAIKFTERGGVTIRIAPGQEEDPKKVSIRLCVQDTGIGLSQTQQEIIFGRFEQASPAIAREFGGTGLGLAVTRAITEAMHGRISVNSIAGQGTQMVVDLSFDRAERDSWVSQLCMDQATDPNAPEEISEKNIQPVGLRILVVDDIPMNREVLARWLSLHQHQVTEAATGEAALNRIHHETFDLVFMDIDLPDMSGHQVISAIRAQPGDGRKAFIVTLSGHGFQADIAASLAAGADEHLTKPVNFDRLTALVAQAVPRASARRDTRNTEVSE